MTQGLVLPSSVLADRRAEARIPHAPLAHHRALRAQMYGVAVEKSRMRGLANASYPVIRYSTSPRVPLRQTGAAILQVHYDAGLGLPEL